MLLHSRALAVVATCALVALPGLCTAQTQAPTTDAGGRRLEPTFIRTTVTTVGEMIAREYLSAEIGERLKARLQEAATAGAYDTATDPAALAAILTADLATLAHDKHLAVLVSRPAPQSPDTRAPAPSRRDAARRDNGGVRRIEILTGNVGYLDLRSFWRPDESDREIAAAMQVLANADALIVDMRENGGGSPETVAHLMSYLIDGTGLPLFEIVPRTGTTVRYATREVAARDSRRPVYVLTSSRTFSAGEGLAFLLQERRRAEVIGEATAGAANPGRPYPVNTTFEVVIPNGSVRSVPGGRNWEGTGVQPDVPAPAADAPRTAHERALRQLLRDAATAADRARIEAALTGPLGLH